MYSTSSGEVISAAPNVTGWFVCGRVGAKPSGDKLHWSWRAIYNGYGVEVVLGRKENLLRLLLLHGFSGERTLRRSGDRPVYDSV
jgi:hypothetical protein